MAETFKVLGIVGSLRKDSFNRKLWQNVLELAPEGFELSEFNIGDLPLYNEDIDGEDRPASAKALDEAIKNADALLFVTPEYNYGIPGGLKNALDWASRPGGSAPIYGKPAAMMGASMGIGATIRAQLALRHVLMFLQMPTVLHPEVLISAAHTKFDEAGKLKDETSQKVIVKVLENLRDLAKKHSSHG